MKISYNWLRKYINTDIPPKRIAEILTSIGLEVEAVEDYQSVKGGLQGIVVGYVLECKKHPNADKLTLTKVDVGNNTILDIVCGAPNIAQGQKVPVALVGTEIFKNNDSFVIKETTIRGAKSQGMICAEDEIGLGESHDGIMVLDDKLQPGTSLKDIFNVYEDVIFEIGLTPNRIDAASHYGVARDLSAFLQHKSPVILEKPEIKDIHIETEQLPIEIIIENETACKRYCGVVLSNVEVKESPEWLKNYLLAIGQKPINNVVDITNFILHEIGQPLHAFDYDKIKGRKVRIKTFPENTSFVTLDGIERKLSDTDLVIANDEEPMCIAGVLGGQDSGITFNSRNIFIESAYFNPVWIRKTSRRHGLFTESSFRFERGTDIQSTIYALKRAVNLIQEICNGKVASQVYDIYPKKVQNVTLELEYSYVDDIIGKSIPKNRIKEILISLEINIIAEKEKSLLLEIPSYRVDVTRPIDVVEEILRIYGFNEVEISSKISFSTTQGYNYDKEKWQNVISDFLVSNGFYEIMTNSLTKQSYYKDNKEYPLEHTVKLLNPLSQDLAVLRQNLLYTGLEAVVYNINRQQFDLKLFEFGKTYYIIEPSKNEKVENFLEEDKLSILISGNVAYSSWIEKERKTNFYFLKRWVDSIIKRMNVSTTYLSETSSYHYQYALVYFYKNTPLVSFGKLSNECLNLFEIKQDVYFAEFNWDKLISFATQQEVTFKELPKYPVVRRDLAMILTKEVKYNQLENIAFKCCSSLLKEVNLFDVYEGESIGQGKKSYAVSFILQSNEKTLTDTEINQTMETLIKAYEKEVGAIIRM